MACILTEDKSCSRKKCDHATGNHRHREDDDGRLRLLDTGGDEHDIEIEVLGERREEDLNASGVRRKGTRKSGKKADVFLSTVPPSFYPHESPPLSNGLGTRAPSDSIDVNAVVWIEHYPTGLFLIQSRRSVSGAQRYWWETVDIWVLVRMRSGCPWIHVVRSVVVSKRGGGTEESLNVICGSRIVDCLQEATGSACPLRLPTRDEIRVSMSSTYTVPS